MSSLQQQLTTSLQSFNAFTLQHQNVFHSTSENIDQLLNLINEIEQSLLVTNDTNAEKEDMKNEHGNNDYVDEGVSLTTSSSSTTMTANDNAWTTSNNDNTTMEGNTLEHVQRFLSSVQEIKTTSLKDFKVLYNTCTKVISKVEKLTNLEIDQIVYKNDWSRGCLDELIIDELCRNGFIDIAKKYIEESHSTVHINNRYEQMYSVLNALKQGDIEYCLKFVREEKPNIKALLEEALLEERQRELKSKEETEDRIDESETQNAATTRTSSVASTTPPASSNLSLGSGSFPSSSPASSATVPPLLAIFPPSPPLPPVTQSSAYVGSSSRPSSRSISLLQSSDSNIHLPDPPVSPMIPLLSSIYQQQYDDLLSLEFQFHRLRFLQLLEDATNPQAAEPRDANINHSLYTETLQYAQIHFPAFAPSRMNEISELSSLLLCLPDLNQSSSSTIVGKMEKNVSAASDNSETDSPSTSGWNAHKPELSIPTLMQAAETSIRKICNKRMGVSNQSPLEICLKASQMAIPQQLEYREIMKMNSTWNGTTNMPSTIRARPTTASQSSTQPLLPPTNFSAIAARTVPPSHLPKAPFPGNDNPLETTIGEVNIERSLLFHSCFICPVTREECTTDNPPVMLRCGHVISLQAMEKMAKSSRSNRRFKCPTCPREQTTQETLILKF